MPFSVQRALRTLAAAVIIALAVTGLRPVAALMPIEGYPSYQPQSKCSPRAKVGTLMLEEYLLEKYPGSGSSGISRSCTASGTSEHKEGRAFDWRLSAGSARDRAYAADFLDRLFATDKGGNHNALARRMGVMYVIWNDRIWSASHGYRKRDYVHGACTRRKLGQCSVTLRHRDHMHISLSRAAARGATSWYVLRSGNGPSPAPVPEPAPKPEPAPAPKPAPKPKPEPKPEPRPEPAPKPTPEPAEPPRRAPKLPDGVIDLRRTPYTRIVVRADGETVETRFKLAADVTYSVTAAGLYTFGGPDEVGDAVCTWSSGEQTWVPKPSRRTKRTYGRLALFVNGRLPFGDTCRESHTYRTEVTPTRDRTLKLRVAGLHPSSRGRLTVVVGRKRAKVAPALPEYPELTPAPTYSTNPRAGYGLMAETVTVPGSAGTATYTRRSLEPGATYRLTVSGRVRLGGGVVSDGQCVSVRRTWYEAASIDPRVPGQDHGNLYVDGAPFAGTGDAGCGSTRTAEVVADARGQMRLDLWDPHDSSDNTGELVVLVQRVTPIPTPEAADRERPRPRQDAWQQRRDELEVDSRRAAGRVSTMRLRRGEQVQVTVTGRFTSGGRAADASCQRIARQWVSYDPQVLGQDPLNVWVDGQQVTWRPVGSRGACSGEYRYRTRFTATKNGPIGLAVLDLDHRDNKGALAVDLKRLGS